MSRFAYILDRTRDQGIADISYHLLITLSKVLEKKKVNIVMCFIYTASDFELGQDPSVNIFCRLHAARMRAPTQRVGAT